MEPMSTGRRPLIFDTFPLKGFELHGEQNFPKSGGALLVYHHGHMVYDMIYLLSKRHLMGGPELKGIVDRGFIDFMGATTEV